jgi:lysophospholipase L1-like esterase/peptidoglycan hydrolase-like protein with peptidoglycan-binding domain
VRVLAGCLFVLSSVTSLPGIAHAQTTTATTSTPLFITRPLSIGAEGSDVMELQNFLKNKGFFLYPTATGFFGTLTKEAVMLFQTKNGLDPIGEVGPVTRLMLTLRSLQDVIARLTTHDDPRYETVTSMMGSTTVSYQICLRCGSRGGSSPAPESEPSDTTAPSISSIASTTAPTTATITWTTDESATSKVVYGSTSSYGSASTSASTVTSHSIGLTGLSSNTTYHYAVVSTDAAGNAATSSDKTFTTTFAVADLPIWSAAVRDTLAGTSNSRVLFIGDSTTAGWDTSNNNLEGNNKAYSHPTVVASLFPNSLGATTSIVGNQNAPNISTYDTRTSFADGWGFSETEGGQVLGGYGLRGLSGWGSPLFNFAPGKAWDTLELYYSTYNGAASANVSINGSGSIAAFDTSTADAGLVKTTITKALGNDTLNTNRVSGGDYNFEGIITYNSNVKEITVLNAGWSGAKVTDVIAGTGPWATLESLDEYAPDLVVIDLGINDWNQGTPTTEGTFKAAMQDIIDASEAAGADVLLVVPVPTGSANGLANQAAFRTYILELADLNDLPVVDFISLWTSYATANGNGWMSDVLHPNATGYAEKAEALFDAIWD